MSNEAKKFIKMLWVNEAWAYKIAEMIFMDYINSSSTAMFVDWAKHKYEEVLYKVKFDKTKTLPYR